ncbi:hypothetical protein PHYSODRAFT_334585 [Phytophthora sojae]|uniref:Uncharacterized protein n=1 Tax=Phytophthora sojae (strain P6497) TaxID=1094619 RepID=G4ZPZ1_PHYSP|nr:hypothetical protein PHYSODRAFT_334585 [Phytophthora sojae]EGZ16395.1 hypothetical protein PHYSODRAFT_334585 [Phytophthora sojae]|eukprot:XP_009530144.1 hypothetical protein PHYSODRAFT_334585 [Phytophthora sojae]
MARRDSSNLDACRGIIYSGRSSQRPSQYELKRGNSTMKVTPRVDLPAGGSAEMEDSPAQQIVVDPYAEPQPGKLSTRSKSGRQSTLADMLWKRSNTNVDLLRRSSASKMHQKLKSRHSLPAGVAVTATNTESEMPPIPDEADGPAETSQLEAPSSPPTLAS